MREEALNEVAEAIAELHGRARLVVVHGGGSYGHYAVQRAGNSVKTLVASVSYWMAVLNTLVVSALHRWGVPAVCLPTWAIAHRAGDDLHVEERLVRGLLEIGAVPVTHGGLIYSKSSSAFEILSGDTLACELAIKLPASTLIFLMDVEGVYTEDPRVSRSAEFIKVLRRDDLQRVRGGSAGIDVTGGLLLKLREALRAAERGVRVALGSVKELPAMAQGVEGRYTLVVP